MKRNRNLACALLIAQTAVLAGCTQNTDQNVKSKVEASIPSVSIAGKNEERAADQKTDTQSSEASGTSASDGRVQVSEDGVSSVNGIIIVNKKYGVPQSYAPGENPEASAALQQLMADMIAQGYAISQNYSGFRSYETQTDLYNNYVAQNGQEAADSFSARPGFSEHQTGLAFDLMDAGGNLLTEPQAAAWLLANAANYGFIVRYQEGKEAITGYMAEPWHIRYIGDQAKAIMDSGLTLEEYLNVSGGDYQ